MKKIKLLLIIMLSFGMLPGCAATKFVQERAGSLAEKQCEKPEINRTLARMAGYVALDKKAVITVHCAGDAEFEKARDEALIARGVYISIRAGDWAGAVRTLANEARKRGIDGETFIINHNGRTIIRFPDGGGYILPEVAAVTGGG